MTEQLCLHYAPDNASLCVRLAMEIGEIPYIAVLVDRAAQDQKNATYLALNPNGLIPTLETPDGVMFETGAILLWLADQHPGTLFPRTTATKRAVNLTWLFWLANTLHPSLRMLFYPAQYAHPASAQAATRSRITAQIKLLDKVWPTVGDTPLLQCYVAPMLRWSALYGGDTAWFRLADYPLLSDFTKAFETTSAAKSVIAAEGLGATAFSAPSYPNPPEGSAI